MPQADESVPAPMVLAGAALKAFAHPLRIRLYQLLDEQGPATSAQLSAQVGESRGSTSYHLRQLARHGLLQEVPDRGTEKERWWQTAPGGFSFSGDLLRRQPDTSDAVELLIEELVQQRTDELTRWTEQSRHMPAEWVRASVHDRTTIRLTPDELTCLVQDVLAVVRDHSTRADANAPSESTGEDGRTRVVLHFDALPWAAPADAVN